MELDYIREGPDHLIVDARGVVLRFIRVTDKRDEVSAILRVSLVHFPGQADADICENRIILTGSTSKRSIVQKCEKRVGGFDWDALIEAGCMYVRHKLEEGAPIFDLADGDEPGPLPPYVVAPLLRHQESTLLFGNGGTGKSTIALMIAWLAATQEMQWGLEGCGDERILYLDWEDPYQDTQKRRLIHLVRGLGQSDRPHILWSHPTTSFVTMLDGLGRQIASEHITGLIIDSAARAVIIPEAAEDTNAFFNALDSLGLGWSLTIAHQPKGLERNTTPFGSGFWWHNPRRIWHVEGEHTAGQSDHHILLEHVKASDDALSAPLAYLLQREKDPALVRVHQEEARRVPTFRKSQNDMALGALEDADHPLTYTEWAAASRIERNSLYTIADRLSKQGKIEKIGKGFLLLHPVSSPFPPPDAEPP